MMLNKFTSVRDFPRTLDMLYTLIYCTVDDLKKERALVLPKGMLWKVTTPKLIGQIDSQDFILADFL